MSDQPMKDPRDGLTVFIEALKGADRVVVETRNALGEMDAHYIHAPEILAAWNTRAAPKVRRLEWKGPFPANGYKRGRWTAGEFSVVRKGEDHYRLYRNIIDEKDKVFHSCEDAKAAAQADYERRILSALTPETET